MADDDQDGNEGTRSSLDRDETDTSLENQELTRY